MKIEKLHIYGFGKHENVEIDLQNGINVFYGENEAGKSTIQQFILHILFGFPQKNAQLLRYEPKSGAMYGGRIHVMDERQNKVIIERVKGKASGDVTLYLEDGTRGGEQELSNLLHSYNRADFEAIFSFSLLQLQGFEKMTEDELTRALLSSGTTGMDTLSIVETQFLKEMGELFKPTGRKPLINQKIEELRELDAEWKEQMEEVEKYEPSIKRLQQLELLIDESIGKEKSIAKQLQGYMHWKQLKPLKESELELIQSLEKIKDQSFPVDGIRRYELIKDKETNIKVTTEQIKDELQSLKSNNDVLSQEQLEALHAMLSSETEWHQLRAKRIQIEEEQSKTLQNQMQQLALVGVDWEKSLTYIVEADVSIQQEDQLISLLHTKESIERELQQETRLLQMKKQDFEQQQTRIQESKRVNRSSSEKNRITGIAQVLIAAILLVGFTLSYLQSNWLMVIATVIICGLVYTGYLLMHKTVQQSNNVQKYESLLSMEQQSLKEQISELENTIGVLERKKIDVTQHIQAFLNRYHISHLLSPSLLPELFKRLRIIQEQQIQLDQMETKLYEVRTRLQVIMKQAKEIVHISLLEDLLFHQLREYYLAEKKKSEEQQSITKKIVQLEAKLKEQLLLGESYAKNITSLFQEAHVESEGDYYYAHTINEQRIELEKEVQHIRLQLGSKELGLHDFEETFEKESNIKLQALQGKRNELMEEKASLLYKTNKLLQEDEQSEKLQQLEQKKAELKELVKKWAAYKAVLEAIKQTIVQLKEERLPEVLERAQDYFKMLTSNSYEYLILNPEGSFEAVKSNGQRYKIAELSQATKEQAYISLRIALALSLKNKAPFPIIMDDPFVHFDRFRLQQVVQLMAELQKEHQLLYFTCHENMRYVWKDAHVLQVATLLAEVEGL